MQNLHAHIILDRSGSMVPIRDKTINAVNEYIEGLRKDKEIDVRVSLTLFDTVEDKTVDPYSGVPYLRALAPMPTKHIPAIDTIYDYIKLDTFPKLTRKEYEPRGWTPLNDAIGQVVMQMDLKERPQKENIALVIVTDGFENYSTRYTNTQVKDMLKARQEKDNWLVMYLGANQDAIKEGANYGVARSTSLTFAQNNITQAMQAATASTIAYATSGGDRTKSRFTTEQRNDAN